MGGLILRLKDDKRDSSTARLLGRAIEYVLRTRYPEIRYDVIVPVPQSGSAPFGSTALLGACLKKVSSIPMGEVLRFSDAYRSGRHLTGNEKFTNARGKVSVVFPTPIVGRRVLLVDDVLTTGGTAHWSAEQLLLAGAKNVDVAVVGRTVTSKHLSALGLSHP